MRESGGGVMWLTPLVDFLCITPRGLGDGVLWDIMRHYSGIIKSTMHGLRLWDVLLQPF